MQTSLPSTTSLFSCRGLSRAAFGLALAWLAGSAWSQTKWDLASAYPASNFHAENLLQFVAEEFSKPTFDALFPGPINK